MFWDGILLYKTFLPFKFLYQTFMFSPLWSVIRRSTSGIEFPTMSGTNNEWARVSLFEYNTYLYSIEIHLLSKQLKDRCCHFSCAFFPKTFWLHLHTTKNCNFTEFLNRISPQIAYFAKYVSPYFFAIKAWKGNRKSSARL